MDVDFWAARVHRHIPSVQSARVSNFGNHVLMDDEGGDEVRAWFPCPFCYVEIEVPLLCVHLQEEHCFDLKNAVCPICAANLGKDPLAHFTVQHAHSIKRRKKSQKSGFWSNVSTNIVKDLRELSSFLGANSLSGPPSGNEPAPDPLLSPFLCTVPLTVSKDLQKDTSSCITATSDAESSKLSPPDEVDGKDYEERRQRAAFVQELLLSTIF
ncbi:UNVERIFIED_CONTAM: protein dehydration-induced [Sesamum angustifolium]|uniref:Protein dehydration-induced n=1 Tax=Sesamum angustifolium TaxID=2727405 RepID=A0AAW2LLH9_9LAMI